MESIIQILQYRILYENELYINYSIMRVIGWGFIFLVIEFLG